jgi:branched-chain amino acid transport system substrate-binding protein
MRIREDCMSISKLMAATALAATAVAGGVSAQDLKIGASLPLTGVFSVSGTKHQQGYQLCVDMINENGGLLGRQVDLIMSDNRSDPATAINQYERFVNVDQVEAVFGTFSSRLTFPVANILSRYGLAHVVPAGGALRIYAQGHKNLFYFQPAAAELVGDSLKRTIEDLIPEAARPKTVAIIRADDFFANGINAGFVGATVRSPGSGDVVADLSPGFIAELGMEIVFQEAWPEEGFNDWLNLANAVRRANPELIIVLSASAEEAVQVTRALQTVRVNPKMLYISQGTQAEFEEGTGAASNGILIHTSWHKDVPFQSVLAGKEFSNADFVAAFEAKYNYTPDEDSAIPFAACQGIEQAIRGAGSTDNAKMIEWLQARTNDDPVRTVLGRFAWDEVGLPVDKAFIMTQWKDGDLQFVYPTDEFDGVSPIVYPKPEF